MNYSIDDPEFLAAIIRDAFLEGMSKALGVPQKLKEAK